MCFKKPKMPAKSQEDIELEEELRAARKQRKLELGNELKLSKEQETEALLARALGFTGNRSLIAGARGGAGFKGKASGRVVGGGTGGFARSSASATSGSSVSSSGFFGGGFGGGGSSAFGDFSVSLL
jgi:hypothetical protein